MGGYPRDMGISCPATSAVIKVKNTVTVFLIRVVIDNLIFCRLFRAWNPHRCVLLLLRVERSEKKDMVNIEHSEPFVGNRNMFWRKEKHASMDVEARKKMVKKANDQLVQDS